MKKFWSEFKAFISKGNVIDLAVAIIIGGAFNKIVSSLVNDIIMPLISLMVGGKNVSDWKWVIKHAEYDGAGNLVKAETALMYGSFIQAIIDFLIIALTIFIMIKVFMASKKKLDQIGQSIIDESKKFTKKTFKKFKKNKKNGDKLIAVQTTQVEQNPQVDNAQPNEAEQSSSEPVVQSTDTSTDTSNQTTTTESTEPTSTNLATTQDANDELLSVLKDIRDYMKENKN